MVFLWQGSPLEMTRELLHPHCRLWGLAATAQLPARVKATMHCGPGMGRLCTHKAYIEKVGGWVHSTPVWDVPGRGRGPQGSSPALLGALLLLECSQPLCQQRPSGPSHRDFPGHPLSPCPQLLSVAV